MVIAVPKAQLAYMAVPKAACSSVKAMLAQVDPDVTLPPPDQRDLLTYHRIYQTRRFRSDDWSNYDGYFRFTVVRDPIKRLMSVYTNRVVEFQDLKNSRAIRNGDAGLPVDPDPDFFYQNLMDYRNAVSSIKHHILPSELFTGPDLGVYDRVYRTSEIPALAAELSEKTGQPLDATRENRSETKLDYADLSPKTHAALRDRLMVEYDHLSDYFDNPLK